MYRHWQMWLAVLSPLLCAYVGATLAGLIGSEIGFGVGMLVLYLTVVNLLPSSIRTVLTEQNSRRP